MLWIRSKCVEINDFSPLHHRPPQIAPARTGGDSQPGLAGLAGPVLTQAWPRHLRRRVKRDIQVQETPKEPFWPALRAAATPRGHAVVAPKFAHMSTTPDRLQKWSSHPGRTTDGDCRRMPPRHPCGTPATPMARATALRAARFAAHVRPHDDPRPADTRNAARMLHAVRRREYSGGKESRRPRLRQPREASPYRAGPRAR